MGQPPPSTCHGVGGIAFQGNGQEWTEKASLPFPRLQMPTYATFIRPLQPQPVGAKTNAGLGCSLAALPRKKGQYLRLRVSPSQLKWSTHLGDYLIYVSLAGGGLPGLSVLMPPPLYLQDLPRAWHIVGSQQYYTCMNGNVISLILFCLSVMD